MLKACSRCGRIHDFNYKCNAGRERLFNERKDTEAARLRSTANWQRKREDIRERAFNLCEVCKANGVYTYEGLSVHHIKKLTEDPSGLLNDNNLVCLCSLHHTQADEGIISPDYLRKLAAERDGETITDTTPLP